MPVLLGFVVHVALPRRRSVLPATLSLSEQHLCSISNWQTLRKNVCIPWSLVWSINIGGSSSKLWRKYQFYRILGRKSKTASETGQRKFVDVHIAASINGWRLLSDGGNNLRRVYLGLLKLMQIRKVVLPSAALPGIFRNSSILKRTSWDTDRH
jgi:hypothetical protein